MCLFAYIHELTLYMNIIIISVGICSIGVFEQSSGYKQWASVI